MPCLWHIMWPQLGGYSPMDKGCSEMVFGRKLACTEAAHELSGTPGRGSHAVVWLVHPLARRGMESTL